MRFVHNYCRMITLLVSLLFGHFLASEDNRKSGEDASKEASVESKTPKLTMYPWEYTCIYTIRHKIWLIHPASFSGNLKKKRHDCWGGEANHQVFHGISLLRMVKPPILYPVAYSDTQRQWIPWAPKTVRSSAAARHASKLYHPTLILKKGIKKNNGFLQFLPQQISIPMNTYL